MSNSGTDYGEVDRDVAWILIAVGVLHSVLVVWFTERPDLGPRDYSPEWQMVVSGFNATFEALIGFTLPEPLIFVTIMAPGLFLVLIGVLGAIGVVPRE